MRRRTVLLGCLGGTIGTAGGHPVPTTSGDTTPIEGPTGSSPLGQLALSGAYELVTSPDGHTAYVATGDGIAVIDLVSPTTPRRIATRRELLADSDDGPMTDVQDVALSRDRLLVVGPAHPGDGAHGVIVFDVSDRTAPRRIAAHETDTHIHNCDFDGRYAYLTASGRESSPLLVLDTETGSEVGSWSVLDADQRWSRVARTLRPLHDVWVQDGIAYLAYWDAGTWILDVTDPADPTPVSRVRGRDATTLSGLGSPEREQREPPGNDHFVTVNDDATLLGVGSESWASDNGSGGPSGIELFDITDPTDPESLSTIEPPPTSDGTRGGVLTTAHNFELTAERCYSAWYNGGVRVHDVSDPTAPRELFRWRDSTTTSFWTAQRGAGCFVASNTDTNGGSDLTPGVYTFPDPQSGAEAADAVGGAGDGFGIGAAVTAVGLWLWRVRSGEYTGRRNY